MTYFYYNHRTWNTDASQAQIPEETIDMWKHVSNKSNWRITELPNGYFQTECKSFPDCGCEDDKENCKEGWNYYIRNWKLAKKLISIMCNKFKLKGVVIGRKYCKLPTGCSQMVTLMDKLPQDELIKVYQQTKFLLLPISVEVRGVEPRSF